jgi:glycerol-3-phosphate dehydrogenase (NAD(P)+)
VVGAGSFGTAVAVLLVRAGVRTTLLCRTVERMRTLVDARANEQYLPGVELPRELKIRALGAREDQFARPDLVFLAVPSKGIGEALEGLRGLGVSRDAGVVSLAKGLVPPEGVAPTTQMETLFGAERVACVGGPAHALEMVESGAGSSARPGRRYSLIESRRPSSARAWCARCPTTRSASSSPG